MTSQKTEMGDATQSSVTEWDGFDICCVTVDGDEFAFGVLGDDAIQLAVLK